MQPACKEQPVHQDEPIPADQLNPNTTHTIYRIWYLHPAASAMLMASSLIEEALTKNPANLNKRTVPLTHRCVCLLTGRTLKAYPNMLNVIYRQMQAEQWSPAGEAIPLIQALSLEHTSMSMGDIIEDMTTGTMWLVARIGFQPIPE